MTKNNQFDGLNYTPPKRTAVDDFAQWYEENGKTIEPETRSEIDILREQYEKNPDSLTSIQLLTLGMAALDKKNEKESQERQKAANEYRQEYDTMNGGDE